MKEIQLTQGKVAIVDDHNFEWLNQWNWYADEPCAGSGRWYAARKISLGAGKQKTITMHRVIAAKTGFPEVDHADLNGLHNWEDNLRPCTRSQNKANVLARSASGFKGVYQIKNGWVAQIRVNGALKNLGKFQLSVEAARAYNNAAMEHFGQFARLNPV